MQSKLTTLLPKESFELKKFKSEKKTTTEIKKKKKKVVHESDLNDTELEQNSQNDIENEPISKTAKRKTGDDKIVQDTKRIKWKKTK